MRPPPREVSSAVADFTHVITAYFPDPERWDEEFKRRKL